MIADEPTTALDVTVQAQIIELLRAMRAEVGMALVLISHDLGVVAGLADRILVMYAGRIVESAAAAELFRHARHPYTAELLKCIPELVRSAPRALADSRGAAAAARRAARGLRVRAALSARRCALSDRAAAARGARRRGAGGRRRRSAACAPSGLPLSAAAMSAVTSATDALLQVTDLRVEFGARAALVAM